VRTSPSVSSFSYFQSWRVNTDENVGYTVLDSVIFHEGTLYIVTDDAAHVPALSAVASSHVAPDQPPTTKDWQVISTADADDKFGLAAARYVWRTLLSMGRCLLMSIGSKERHGLRPVLLAVCMTIQHHG
jgi:hypothetical protein